MDKITECIGPKTPVAKNPCGYATIDSRMIRSATRDHQCEKAMVTASHGKKLPEPLSNVLITVRNCHIRCHNDAR